MWRRPGSGLVGDVGGAAQVLGALRGACGVDEQVDGGLLGDRGDLRLDDRDKGPVGEHSLPLEGQARVGDVGAVVGVDGCLDVVWFEPGGGHGQLAGEPGDGGGDALLAVDDDVARVVAVTLRPPRVVAVVHDDGGDGD